MDRDDLHSWVIGWLISLLAFISLGLTFHRKYEDRLVELHAYQAQSQALRQSLEIQRQEREHLNQQLDNLNKELDTLLEHIEGLPK